MAMFSLFDRPDGVEAFPGRRIVYDVASGEARFGAHAVKGHALVWELAEDGGEGALLSAEVELDLVEKWLVRCDRVDFPPGGVAYRHVHPGPGIRYLLFGALTIAALWEKSTYRPGEAWFEGAEHPVLATASEAEETAFVRVLLLPAEWAGKRTIRYLEPADEERPKLQRATILLEQPIAL
jgi:quercetin dioxygenase-like cupin family protein